jgi:hypothetical protein
VLLHAIKVGARGVGFRGNRLSDSSLLGYRCSVSRLRGFFRALSRDPLLAAQYLECHGFMNTVMKLEPKDIDAVPFQEASLDIWDKKYRLTAKDGTPIDKTMDDTYQRVARALADVEKEEVREHWYERFLWALRRGAIPAGRVTSNAGALEHKPATSTINCTVSGTIHDSMDDILQKVHEAGLTLKVGSGIGYCFSTLRPRGRLRVGRGCVHVGPAVVHGYLRQDVLYRVVCRRSPRRADGHI